MVINPRKMDKSEKYGCKRDHLNVTEDLRFPFFAGRENRFPGQFNDIDDDLRQRMKLAMAPIKGRAFHGNYSGQDQEEINVLD